MKQLTLATVGFERNARTRRRAAFLAEMERVVPWSALCALIEPFYPKPGNGRPPVGVERMLRIYFLQQWFNLSDPAVEEALYDSLAMRRFVDIDLGREPVPHETTVCQLKSSKRSPYTERLGDLVMLRFTLGHVHGVSVPASQTAINLNPAVG